MSAKDVVKDYILKATALLVDMNTDSVADITKELEHCINRGGKILICGNGGSASDASHFAGELVGRFKRERKPIAAMALTVDTAVITALANDYGYENVFFRQVEALGRDGDVLIAITTSGVSKNIIKAAEIAGKLGLRVVAFTSARCDKPQWADLHWKSTSEETCYTQEQMLMAFHAICYGLEICLADKE